MAQTTKWLPAILDYVKNVMSNISTCLAWFPNLTASIRSISIQWNLSRKDSLGPQILSFTKRFSTQRG